jgi:arylsulfatase A-like enzyme
VRDAIGGEHKDFKSARYDDGLEELYDLTADPWELENKASDPAYAADLAKFRTTLDQLKTCAGANCWVE